MYCILMDKETKSFYMAPHEFFFHAYTGREYIKKIPCVEKGNDAYYKCKTCGNRI